MNRSELLGKLPPYTKKTVTINRNQTVGDIVNEVLAAHKIFANDYDSIAAYFDHGSNLDIAKNLFYFLKQNVRYKVESEENQTTKSPAALLETAQGDCKHYAGFIAGVLDALKRRGRKIDWFYRFASYNLFDQLPGHVFVVLKENNREYWIDPVLKTFDEKLQPVYTLDRRPNKIFMLERISGIGEALPEDAFTSDEEDNSLSPELVNAITILYSYGVLNAEGLVNDAVIETLSTTLPQEDFEKIAQARILLHNQAIGGFFSNIWNGVKKVTLAIPRNAYLSLILVNAFGLATKISNVLYNKDGSYYLPAKDKLKKKWESLGGSFSHLEGSVKKGMTKKAILGAAPAIPAWVAAASAIIAALAPIIQGLLKQKASEGQLDAGIDPLTGLPYGLNETSPTVGIMDFIRNNPLVIVAGGAAAIYFLTQRKKSA